MIDNDKMALQSSYIERDLKEWLLAYSRSLDMNPSSLIRRLLKQERERVYSASQTENSL